jgi:hypothetical protein
MLVLGCFQTMSHQFGPTEDKYAQDLSMAVDLLIRRLLRASVISDSASALLYTKRQLNCRPPLGQSTRGAFSSMSRKAPPIRDAHIEQRGATST